MSVYTVDMSSSNDFCRLCKTNLRINGVLTNSRLLFEHRQASKEKILAQRLEDVGCNLSKDKSKSSRMCRSCWRVLDRIESDFDILAKWRAEENDETTEEAASLKRTSEFTPSKTPRSAKKMRPKPATPAQSSKTTESRPSRPSTEMPLWQSQTQISSGTTGSVSQSPPPAELSDSSCSVTSVDHLNESLYQETELSSAATSKSDESRGRKCTQTKTIVNDSCLMELFKKCQTCGHTITKRKVSHCGAQTKVRWSCLGGHKGVWMSSPYLWEAFPEIHLLTALSILFSGGTFTHFRKWAKHLHLNFMDLKTFLEVQKTHISPEIRQKNRKVQEEISAQENNQQPEGSLCYISDALKKIKAKRREKRAQSSRSSSEKGSSVLKTTTETSIQESSALSGLESVSDQESEQRYQDEAEHQSDSMQTTHTASMATFFQDRVVEIEVTIDDDERNSMKNLKSETTGLRMAGPDDGDEDVYVPIIPQRSTASELLLECEEEELEPWQKNNSLLKVKVKDEVEDLANDQPEPSTHQERAVNTSPPDLKTETTQSGAFNNKGFFVAPQLTRSTSFHLQTQCLAGTSFAIVPAVQQQLFQKSTPEPCGVVHTPQLHQITNNPVSFSSVLSPAVFVSSSSNQQQADQSKSQILSVPFSLPCFTLLKKQ